MRSTAPAARRRSPAIARSWYLTEELPQFTTRTRSSSPGERSGRRRASPASVTTPLGPYHGGESASEAWQALPPAAILPAEGAPHALCPEADPARSTADRRPLAARARLLDLARREVGRAPARRRRGARARRRGGERPRLRRAAPERGGPRAPRRRRLRARPRLLRRLLAAGDPRLELPDLRAAGARDPLAAGPDRPLRHALGRRTGVLPEAAPRRRDRQPRPARRRGHPRLRRERARPLALAPRRRRDARLLRRPALDPLQRVGDPGRRRPAAGAGPAALGRDRRRRLLDVAHAPG